MSLTFSDKGIGGARDNLLKGQEEDKGIARSPSCIQEDQEIRGYTKPPMVSKTSVGRYPVSPP